MLLISMLELESGESLGLDDQPAQHPWLTYERSWLKKTKVGLELNDKVLTPQKNTSCHILGWWDTSEIKYSCHHA